MTPDATPSSLSRKLHDLLHREAHLKLWRTQVKPLWSQKEAELRAVESARPMLLPFMAGKRRDDYLSRLARAQEDVARLRQRIALLDLCEPHIAKMIEHELEHLLREECPEYIQALAAQRQKEDWLRCLERFGQKIFEFTRALGNVRNIACSGYERHSQVFSTAAVQAFGLAYVAAEQVEHEVRFANRISDAQLQTLQVNGIKTKPLPLLPETGFCVWVDKIKSMSLADAQSQFDTLIETTKKLAEAGMPGLRQQFDQVQTVQEADIRNFLVAAWDQFRSEIAPEIFAGDTERSVTETEAMLVKMGKASVLGRL